MYQMHRVFCATSWELEAERRAFHDAIAEVNEAEGIAHGVLLVPVTLVNIRDKRPLQYTVDENIRDCRFFLLALADGWGPPERHFERDYRLALACRTDSALPMRETAFLWQKRADESAVPPGLPAPTAEFSTADEFKAQVRALLSAWLAAVRT
jgi:hypothetical protein